MINIRFDTYQALEQANSKQLTKFVLIILNKNIPMEDAFAHRSKYIFQVRHLLELMNQYELEKIHKVLVKNNLVTPPIVPL